MTQEEFDATRDFGALVRDRILPALQDRAKHAEFEATLVRDGLVTFCQYTLSSVDDGRYRTTVLADSEATGCGARGARVVLWTFADDQQLYSRKTLGWPGDGRTISFDTDFSTAAPDGAVPETVGFVGEAYDANAEHLPGGARVEVYVGTTRCGIASVRRTGGFSGYSIAVVGPDSIPGCDRGAELTFRINGKPTVDTRPNDDSSKRTLDVSLRQRSGGPGAAPAARSTGSRPRLTSSARDVHATPQFARGSARGTPPTYGPARAGNVRRDGDLRRARRGGPVTRHC